MVNLKLLELHLKNFKGTSKLDLVLNGNNLTVSGRNGIGKTTIFDALCWLMTGKDSKGNQPESEGFQIKPRELDGTVKSGVMPTVTAVFDVGTDRPLKLEKTFKEKWEKKRGQANPVFSGHTTEYFIDDIPRKESEFKNILSAFIDESTFRLLTDVYRFPNGLKWQERRAILFDICNIKTDGELMAQDSRFAPLLTAVGQWSVDEYKTGLKNQRRKVNQNLETLPIRIDEVSNSIADLTTIDFDNIQAQADEQEKIIERLQAKLVEIDNNTAMISMKNQLEGLQNQLAKLENENITHRLSQQVPQEDKRQVVQKEVDLLERQLQHEQSQMVSVQTQIQNANTLLGKYREQWKAISKEQFSGNTVCPACGQSLPKDKILEALEHFNNDKKARQDRLLSDSQLVKENLANHETALKQHEQTIEQLRAKIIETVKTLENTPEVQAPVIEDLPNYAEDTAKLQTEILKLNNSLMIIVNDTVKHKQDVNIELLEAKNLYSSLLLQLAKKDKISEANARIDELHAEQRTVSAELDRIDKMLALCEDFARYKVNAITSAINSKFNIVTFRLFREQINGGLEDCCDVMLNGKPYGTISDGEKIKVGIDIVQTLTKHFDVQVPMIVDCAESVTDFPQTTLQTIKLIVKDSDMEVQNQ